MTLTARRTTGPVTCLLVGVLAGGLLLGGCAGRYDPTLDAWPYPRVSGSGSVPPPLSGLPLFAGRWIEADPSRDLVMAETTDPRFVARFSFTSPRTLYFFDLGPGTEAETAAFLDGGRSVLFVGAVISPHHARAVVARSLLLVDLEQGLLLDTISLSRDGISRGLAVDRYKNRAFILHDNGLGDGSLQRVDLYGGQRVEEPTGTIPEGLGRKGVVLDRTANTVFCLAGGQSSRPDFAPVTDQKDEGPALLALDADSLTVIHRIALGERFQPRALAYEALRDRVYVLASREGGSELLVVGAAFADKRAAVNIPEETTDLVISGGYAFMPGAHGIYIVDLDLESLISRPYLPLELTGEMVVSDDQSVALVSFQAAQTSGPPGIAKIGLQSGNLMDVIQ